MRSMKIEREAPRYVREDEDADGVNDAGDEDDDEINHVKERSKSSIATSIIPPPMTPAPPTYDGLNQ
jgi:hypothetical protein